MIGAGLLEHSAVYRIWQAPFARRKIAPVLDGAEYRKARSVLDVGCGPGTSTGLFSHVPRYLGVDISEAYIDSARRRHGRPFIVADVTKSPLASGDRFDLILVNSLFHHIDDDGVRSALGRLVELLEPGGRIHVLDLVLPRRRGVARALARLDRGDHPRPLEEWRYLLGEFLRIETFQPYGLGIGGLTLWNMVYVKGGGLD